MQRRKVDLPDPEGPMTHTTSPSWIVAVRPRRTWLAPKDLWRSVTSTMGAAVVGAVMAQRSFFCRASMRRTMMDSGRVMIR